MQAEAEAEVRAGQTRAPRKLPARLTDKFLLRDAERWARTLADGERSALIRQMAFARQKLDCARLLCLYDQHVEALRLTQESVSEALQAAELAGTVFPGRGEAAGARDDLAGLPGGRTLAALGASDDDLHNALVAYRGVEAEGPRLNQQLRPADRTYLERAIPVAASVLDKLKPLVASPRNIIIERWARLLGVGALVLLAAVATIASQRGSNLNASASYSAEYGPANLVDGNPESDWYLPDAVGGFVEVRFPAHTPPAIKVLNARNLPNKLRGTNQFRIEGLHDGKIVHTSRHSFPTIDAEPDWITVTIPAGVKLDTIRLHVESWYSAGGGFAELVYK